MEKSIEPLLEVSEARERLLENHFPLGIEMVEIQNASGRTAGGDIPAPFDYPLFPNSSMDGFAVRSMDLLKASLSEPVLLQVIADIPAGSSLVPRIGSGQAARIMTGAMIPPGADAVVPIEDTDTFQNTNLGDLPEYTQVTRSVKPGEFIRPLGQDVKIGQLLLTKGRRLGPAQIGLCATFGIRVIPVWKKPRVAIISSGNEILSINEEIIRGKVYDANSLILTSLVDQCGGMPIPLGIVADHPEAIKEKMDFASSLGVDLIISSAGVSVGAYDYMRSVIEENGAINFWKVNMRPGKPLVSGNYRGIPYLGLPGNPVSAFVGFLVFIEPLIKKMAGKTDLFRKEITVKLLTDVQSDGRQSYLRGFISDERGILVAKLIGHQGSGDIYSLGQANTLLIIPSGVKSVRSGEEVKAWSLVEDSW